MYHSPLRKWDLKPTAGILFFFPPTIYKKDQKKKKTFNKMENMAE